MLMKLSASCSLALVFTLTVGRTAAALPFVEDDFERARAEATARKLPLFVEAWAPW
jgi:hypothetical protein